jgi:hypothetical protein
VIPLKKADEMEMAINFKSMRLSWVFVIVSLFIWLVAEYLINGRFNFIPFIIIVGQNVIFFGSKIYMTRKMAGNNDEK